MMDRSTLIREKVFQTLSGYSYQGTSVPVFDEVVNPNILIPSIGGAREVYIVFQDQQEQEHPVQTVCSPRFSLSFTLRIVTTWDTVGSKKLAETIGNDILYLLRDDRGNSLISDIQEIQLVTARSLFEKAETGISFSKVIILNFVKNG